MTLPLELGGIHDPAIRRQLEIISQQFPVVATGGGGGGAPSGPAGGVLGGTYPNPGFAADMATQAELDTHTTLTTTAHGGIVASTDPRLTDARAPTAHKTSHEPGGTDALTGLTNTSIAAAAGIAKTKLANLDIVDADVNAAAAIAEAKLSLATDAAAGTGSRRTLGTGALQAAAGNDARFTDARTPTAHATTHQPGGTDAMAADAAAGTGSLRTLGTTATSAAAGNRGLPVGGATGEVLAKNSATDYDTGWVAAGGGGVTGEVWTAVVSQAADITNATTTNVNTDLVFSFAANSTYIIDLYLIATAAATTTGFAFAFDTSVAVTVNSLTFEHNLAAAGTLSGGDAIADDTVRGLSSGVPTAAALVPILGNGLLVTGATAGTCRLRFRPEVAASATFKAGSTMRVMKVGATSGAVVPVVAGRITSTGTITAGTGFSVSKTATGTYVITFTALVPLAVNVTMANGNVRLPTTSAYTATSVTVNIYTTAVAAIDDAFAFVAVGS